ncbi:ABC nitrate transporter, nucleotide binding/ATPase protein (plasmid) [Ensifer adhaerens OV14]|nr:ABC nitrate transporter, nucleotide binding/ATPase protein [Ensifer adhaerens OV14]
MQFQMKWSKEATDLAQPVLTVDAIGKTYGSGPAAFVAIKDISLSVARGEFVSILGPSGCGKTTLIKLIAGLMQPTSGSIQMFGQQIRSVPDSLAVVFQDYSRSLFPWMRVGANVAFALQHLKLSRGERRERTMQALEAVGLKGIEQKYPWELSGGMQQRVAIARAIAYRPRLLLMDEPFASVDAQTRAELEDLTLRVHRDHDMTTLFITHDIDEAVYLANRVIVLGKQPGRLVGEIFVDLPQERDQIATKELSAFVRLRGDAARRVRDAALGKST